MMSNPVQVIIAVPGGLMRDGLAALLRASSTHVFQVVASVADAAELINAARRTPPDLVIVHSDIECDPGLNLRNLVTAVRDGNDRTAAALFIQSYESTITVETSAIRHANSLTLSGKVEGDALLLAIDHLLANGHATHQSKHQGEDGRSKVLLTPRETEITRLVACGLSNKEIATRTGLKLQTVKNHISRLLEKLNLIDRVQLAVYALDHELRKI